MLRSLFSGVTGLEGNIVELDVVGNNIANVNTVGFKSARVTFQEILTQNLRPATRPSSGGGLGGTNPRQIGLGTVVGSIDSEFAQGNLRTTGNKTDLAIQGDGFFVLSDGATQRFSRAGNFTFDSNNTLVSSATGLKVQGLVADTNGNFVTGAIGDVVIDPSTVVPAEATTEVTVFGNLSSESGAIGSHLLSSDEMLVVASNTDDLRTLRSGENGDDLTLSTGNLIALTGTVGGADLTDIQFEVGQTPPLGVTTIQDLADAIQTELNALSGGGITVSLHPSGSIEIANASGDDIDNLQLSVGGKVEFNQTVLFPEQILAGTTAESVAPLLSPADENSILDEVYNGDGTLLNFIFSGAPPSTALEIGGTLGGEAITTATMQVEQGVTTIGDLLNRMETAFQISNGQAITLTAEGRIDVVGDVGAASAIDNVSLRETGNAFSNLQQSIDFRVIDVARDAEVYSVTTTVYDSLGSAHNLTLDFTKRTGENFWDWTARLDGDEQITRGEQGTVVFDEHGSLISFLYADGGGQISFQPDAGTNGGAAPVTISINPGDIGGVNGLTQFEPQDQIQSYADGFTVGRLVDFDIDRQGIVSGRFSNDTVRDLARIAVATFNNDNGLVRSGNNTYQQSGNSGQAIVGFATEGGIGELSSGALEASNVDLSEQFTRLVVSQRAFQASARVITTSDEVLQELVNIV